jgi:hypothetical protein
VARTWKFGDHVTYFLHYFSAASLALGAFFFLFPLPPLIAKTAATAAYSASAASADIPFQQFAASTATTIFT